MDELITQIGIPGIVVILILREVMPFMSKTKSKEHIKELADRAARADEQLTSIHKALDVKDSDGVRLIYSRRSVDKMLGRLGDCIEMQTNLLRSMHEELKDSRRDMQSMKEAVVAAGRNPG